MEEVHRSHKEATFGWVAWLQWVLWRQWGFGAARAPTCR